MEGTNYIDNRFPCKDMVRHVIAGQGCIATIDAHGRLLYIVIFD